MSYVILQALGVMPLQLLNLGVILPRFLFLAFFTRTPRGKPLQLTLITVLKMLYRFC
jgi:hypothetical protein